MRIHRSEEEKLSWPAQSFFWVGGGGVKTYCELPGFFGGGGMTGLAPSGSASVLRLWLAMAEVRSAMAVGWGGAGKIQP